MALNFHLNSVFIPLLLLPILVALAWFFYRRTNPPISRRLRRFLFALRAAALCLLTFLLFEPMLTFTSTVTEKPTVALLVDRSQSMSLTDSQGNRQKQLVALLASSTLDSLAQCSRLKIFAFADDFTDFDLVSTDSLFLTGQGTDIGSALEELERKFEPEELSGLILLSDGANNLGKDPLSVAKRMKVPIFTVGIGSPQSERDIRLSGLLFPPVAYTGDRLPLEVTIQSWGYTGVRATVILSEKGEKLAQQYVTLTGEGREQQVGFELPVEKPGLHHYQVSIPVGEGELSPKNNRQRFKVKILDSRIRVLLVAGGPSPDFAFLRKTLERGKDVEVHPLVIKKANQFYQGKFPASGKDLREFKLVILLDLPRSVIRGRPERLLSEFVRQGGGLLVIGGEDGFRGYKKSPLANVLPVALRSGVFFRSGEFQLELSAPGERHPVTILSEDPMESQRMWVELPPLAGVNRLEAVRPEAILLAYYEDPTGTFLPLVVVGSYGKGRVMVAPFCGFWRWDLVMWGIVKTNRASDKFWQNTVAWLTVPRDLSPVQVSTDKKVYRSGEKVNLQVQLYDPLASPLSEANVIVTLSRQGIKQRQLQLKDCGDGMYRSQLSKLVPGTYQAEVIAWKGNEKVGQGRGEFTVDQYSLEFQQTQANYELLKRMAYHSGGRFCRVEEFSRLLGQLDLKKQRRSHTRSVRLYSYPWILALVLGLIATEWTVRRKRRLL
ncbi:MAG: hypothetical protein KAT86_03255 [Candidatus Latescibacteria bacterium]|nr:hypothetical protein [Candidatus Latescibacterota bacterium]